MYIIERMPNSQLQLDSDFCGTKESGAGGRSLASSRVLVAIRQLDTTKYFIDLIFLLVGGG